MKILPSKYWWRGFVDGLSFGPLYRIVHKLNQLKRGDVMGNNEIAEMKEKIDALCKRVDELETYSSITVDANPGARFLNEMKFEKIRIYDVILSILSHLNLKLTYKPGTEAQTVLEKYKKTKARML